MSETKVAPMKKHKSLARGLIAGLIAGLAATAAKTLAERIFPPQPKLAPQTFDEPQQQNLAEEPVAAFVPSPAAIEKQNEALRWGLGAVTGAAYGAVAEFYPEATAKHGASFGLALEALAHPGELPVQGARVVGCWPFLKLACTSAQPALGLAAEPDDQIARERGSQITSYVVYGVTAELVRRMVRRWL
jgi:putative membrane protein